MTKSLEFTLSVSRCLGCKPCPQGVLGEAYDKLAPHMMSLKDFLVILAATPKDVEIHFSGFSECFLNPNASRMINAASKAGRKIFLYTTLMGISDGDVERLKESHITYVRLHLPDKTDLKIPAQSWLRRFEAFLKTGHKFTAMAMSAVEPEIEKVITEHGVAIEYPEMLSRAGNAWKDRHITGKIRCAANRWHNNVVLPSGDVVACCNDWSLSMPLGNILRQPYEQIEKKANEYEANNNPPDDSVCRFCNWCAPA